MLTAIVGGEGRQFAMMAAQRSDMLWIRCSFCLIFYTSAASATPAGMFIEVSVFNAATPVDIIVQSLLVLMNFSMGIR